MISWQLLLYNVVVIVASVASILLVIVLFYQISKRQAKKSGKRPFCPNCGGSNLWSQKTDLGETYFVGSLHSNHTYACQDCKFIGKCPFGTPQEIEAYIKQLKKK